MPEPEPEPRFAAGVASVNGSARHHPTGVSFFSRGPLDHRPEAAGIAGRGKSDTPAASASVTESRHTPLLKTGPGLWPAPKTTLTENNTVPYSF